MAIRSTHTEGGHLRVLPTADVFFGNRIKNQAGRLTMPLGIFVGLTTCTVAVSNSRNVEIHSKLGLFH